LGIRFRLDDEFCRGEFTPGDNHCGFDGQTHGGILYSALDDVMANWLFLRGARGHTARCEMRYRQPLPTGTEVHLEARLTKLRGKLAQLEGRAVRADDGSLVAQCNASFMIADPGPPGALE
jgi:acyl-coenzyme A thioesterase PaaI-like protein